MDDKIIAYLKKRGDKGATVSMVAKHLGLVKDLDPIQDHAEIASVEYKLRKKLRRIVDAADKGARTQTVKDEFNRPRRLYTLA